MGGLEHLILNLKIFIYSALLPKFKVYLKVYKKKKLDLIAQLGAFVLLCCNCPK